MKEQVEKGLDFMDREFPGWHRGINTETLDMGDHCLCVGGQRHGTYDEFLAVTGMKTGREHGFHLPKEDARELGTHKAWKALRELWVEGIELRLLRDELEAAQKIGVRTEEELVGALR